MDSHRPQREVVPGCVGGISSCRLMAVVTLASPNRREHSARCPATRAGGWGTLMSNSMNAHVKPRLAGVITVAATVLAVTLGTASLAGASAGDPWVLGATNSSTPTTYLNWDKSTNPVPEAALAVHGGDVAAVFSNAIYWPENYPTGLTGVAGYGNDLGGFFFGVDSGVTAKGWYNGLTAEATDEGAGVKASGDWGVVAQGDDVGVEATAPTALVTHGAVSFSTAGLATVAKGATSVTVPATVDVTAQTKVLATAQSAGGQVLRVRRNVAPDTITIVLSAPATSAVVVAFFVMQ